MQFCVNARLIITVKAILQNKTIQGINKVVKQKDCVNKKCLNILQINKMIVSLKLRNMRKDNMKKDQQDAV
jgi:hypothetical protein